MSNPAITKAWLDSVDTLNTALRHADERERFMIGTLLSGTECTILGKRARCHVEWLDEPPYGMTEEQVREYGRRMLPQEGA